MQEKRKTSNETARPSQGEDKMRQEEAAVSETSLHLPSAGVFINSSGERLVDNLLLSIHFNPFKDLNVH